MFSKFSVKKPFTVLVAVVMVIVLGIVSFSEMVIDLLPAIDLPYVIVMTTYVGASPEEVEQTVTRPIEQSMATISNIKNVTSTSSENVSMVMMEFNDDVNMDAISIDVRENLDTISNSWSDSIGNPMILKINMSMLPVMVAALDVEGMDLSEISTYANEKLIPQIESVDGVASVSPTGLIEESVNVVIRQEKIDKINKQVYAAINEKMADAEKQMNDAKAEIEAGKAELESALALFNEGIFAGEQAIMTARLEILKGEIELANGEKELSAKEQELLSGEKELNTQKQEIANGEAQILTGEAELSNALAAISAGETELNSKINQMSAAISAIEGQIAAIEGNTELSDAEKAQMLAVPTAQLSALKSGLQSAQAAQSELTANKAKSEAALAEINAAKAQMDTGKAAVAQAETQISSGKTALSAAKSQINVGKSEIESGKAALDEKEKELNETKTEKGEEIANGLEQLEKGEEELKSQLESFDNTKENALEAADVNKIITTDMVSKILTAQNFSMPAGYVTEEGVDYLVRVGDKLSDVDEISNLVLFDMDMEGIEPITLSDAADVFMVDNSAETYASINGNNAIILSMQKQTNFSTAEVADKITDKFEDITKNDSKVKFTTLMDQGMYINMVVDSVIQNLLMGGVLAIIILLLFLRDLKPTFIIACSIPISLMFAIVLMYFSGVTINIISLSGLAVGVGMLVDNSIVVIENIYRLRSKGVSRIQSAVSGAKQVAGAITSSTLTTVCVFLPIVFVKGITRQLFEDMALTIGYSLLASLIVAVTLVPAMSAGLLKNTKEKKHGLMDKFCSVYEKMLSFTLKYKALAIIAAVLLLFGSAFGAYQNGRAFMPEMDSTQVSITLKMPEGTILKDTAAMSEEIMSRVSALEDVNTVGAMLSSGANSLMGMSSGNVDETQVTMSVILNEDKDRTSQEIALAIEELCSDLDCEVKASGSEMDMSALGGAGISINIKGSELEVLQSLATDVAEIVSGVEGTDEVSDGMENPTPELKITVNKEKAMIKGLTVAQIYMEIAGKVSVSSTATKLSSDGKEFSVDVSDGENIEMTREAIRDYVFTVTGKDGTESKVKLEDIADIEDTFTMSSIKREAQTRYITVSCAVADGHNITHVSEGIENALKDFDVPNGYSIEYSGENETINEALFQLVKMLALAILFIYLIMVAQFQSLLSPFIVMFTIPLAFTGGFLGLLLTDNEVSVVAMIGFVMLSGIVVNNGIVLVDYINQLRLDGAIKRDAIIEAGKTRMRPILMTALTTILGLSTMAIGVGMGSDMVQPIAIVTIGGLIYATITTLFIVPVMYDIFNKKPMKKIDKSEFEILED